MKEGLLGFMKSLIVLMKESIERVCDISKRSWESDLADLSGILAFVSWSDKLIREC